MMTASRPPRTLTWPTLPPALDTSHDISTLNEELEFCGAPCRHHPRSDKYPYVGEGKHIPSLQKFVEDLSDGLEGVFPNRQATYNRVHALLISWGDNDDLGTKTEVDRLKEIFESKAKYNFTAEHYEIPPERSKQRLERHCVNVREDHCCLASDLLIVYYGGHGIFKSNRSIWQAWKVKPSTATTERESSPELDWTEAQRSLMTADGDVLFILDCCYATFTSKVEPEGGSKELLAATSFKQKATGVGDNSFTTAFIRELENTNLLPYTAIQIHERLLNNYHQYNIPVPQYVGLYCPPGSKSIVLVPQKADVPFGSQFQAVGVGALIPQPMFITDCRILISIALDNPYQPPDFNQWRDWFTKAAPRNIGGVNFSIEKYVRAEGAWESTSTLYLFSLPAALWNSMPSNGAYKMLGIIKSENLLKPRYSSRGTQVEVVVDNSLSRPFRPLKSTTIQTRLGAGNARINFNLSFGQKAFIALPRYEYQNPFRLVRDDILSVFQLGRLLPLIIQPVIPFNSRLLDELYPSWSNIWALTLHMVLLPIQLATLPFMAVSFWILPGFVALLYSIPFLAVTFFFTRLLNGPPIMAKARVGFPPDGVLPANDDQELWFFINGVATGKDWCQSNLDLLAQTFQREIVGIHNTTVGFIFDLIQCFIQRDLDYKTGDILIGRAQLLSALTASTTKKVVLITHSQGGIAASSIIDWLLTRTPTEALSKLEIYSFGSAARHFSNPVIEVPSHTRSIGPSGEALGGRCERVFKHIEHYANSDDFVANIGVLKFTSLQAQHGAEDNRFYGPVFIRKGSGHLLNLHYLDTMFTMVDGKVDDKGNEFMNSLVPDSGTKGARVDSRSIKDISRLWQYRNGGHPRDD